MQLAVLVLVFQHFVPFKGNVLSPVALSVYVPPGDDPNIETVVVDALLPNVNVEGVSVIAGEAGVLVRLPVNVPVLTIFAAGHGTVEDVQASTVKSVAHKLAVPGCLISKWS